ncbi:MAG: TIGR04255 family protein [Verrucomicrobia bacterium]|nr:TIGR04255 family protein [Verrucomicrobiota bacterium]
MQLGPRVVSLSTKSRTYPGWPAIRNEPSWLLERVRAAGFVRETERIGVRYIDFFSGDVFPNLKIGVHIEGAPLKDGQIDVTTVLRFGKITTRLQVTNGAIVVTAAGPEVGSVLDIDGWVGPNDSDLFGHGLERFTELHDMVKRLFYSLLKPDYLAQLNPVYP